MPIKCRVCNGCMDTVYFGPKRFLYCDFCCLWYDGIVPDIYIVSREEAMKYFELMKNSITSTKEEDNKNEPTSVS